ncbi:MAG: HAMP domain-containing sensor histidine kinase [Anaerosomatales bacterium]|nr:HAMP domain-containing sensor histidine kinase [Anaerosomatales bacterium]
MVVDELRQANLAKDRFMRTVSHELRTPLNSVIGFSDLLLRGYAGELNEEQRRQVAMVRDAGEHLLAIVEQVLEVAGIESGEVPIEIASFDAVELVREVVEMLLPEAHRKGLDVAAETPSEQVLMLSDRTKVKQILMNLVGNAVKFCDRGGVTVELRAQEDRIRFRVRDTGPGVPEEIRHTLFEEFVQGTLPDGSRPDGVGLGLAIARRLAVLLGGTLELAETSERGSVFELRLPTDARTS